MSNITYPIEIIVENQLPNEEIWIYIDDVYTDKTTVDSEGVFNWVYYHDSANHTLSFRNTEGNIVFTKYFDESGETTRVNKHCKYFHKEPYMTPNNFDLYFDYNRIPINVKKLSSVDLVKKLQRHLPLSKILHLNLESKSIPYNNQVNISTKTKIKFKRITNDGFEEEVEAQIK